MSSKVRTLACGIFRQELARLPPELLSGLRLSFLDSMLHMQPEKLDQILHTALLNPEPTLLVYGDCCHNMDEFIRPSVCRRTAGVNCCEIMLGSPRYCELRSKGSFFFMPEWTERWAEVFKTELGFADPDLARRFMADSMSGLVYLDTGVSTIPSGTIKEIEAFMGMPVRIEHTGLQQLELSIRAALKDLGAYDGA
ncbi:MAG: DUF1638 domain-containing protein [Spirochaetes bacterium]|nr:DUF1638 domain-containing protein [Spirochaetota bacterium]MBU0955543.1 DUF1638 domain-containing protein [Spirochaetota bacterium]